jgi:hypothetical protein
LRAASRIAKSFGCSRPKQKPAKSFGDLTGR